MLFCKLVDSLIVLEDTYMYKFLRANLGFTLIELLTVVAIIGILAAIAIPQLNAYRMRGFNAAAASDLRNFKTVMESYFMDNQFYP